jgi:gas vesicle protein
MFDTHRGTPAQHVATPPVQVTTSLTEGPMTILDRTPDTGRLRIDATRFADELARRLPDADQLDLTKARETAGTAVHDAAERARETFDQAAEMVRVLRSDIAHAGDKVQADGPLDEVGQRVRAVASTTAIRALIARLERELPDTDRDRYARAFARGRAQGRSKHVAVGLTAGVSAGIIAALLLEPEHGKVRRERIGRKVSSLTTGISSRAASTAKSAGDRARGIAVQRGLIKPEAGTPEAVTAAVSGQTGAPDVIDAAADAVADATADAGDAANAIADAAADALPTT